MSSVPTLASPRSTKRRISDSPDEDKKSTKTPAQIRAQAVTSIEKALIAKCLPATVAGELENCLFESFGDTNQKYFTKLRSIVFNLRDKKNPKLAQKVTSGEIPPRRLVEMSTADMASQELADWRHYQENKNLFHIKRISETSLPNIKMTHKGEVPVGDEDMNVFNNSNEQIVPQSPPAAMATNSPVPMTTNIMTTDSATFSMELRELERLREETELMLAASDLCPPAEEHVWEGDIIMEDIVNCRVVMDPIDEFSVPAFIYELLPPSLDICGRIQSQHAFDFLRTCLNSRRKELVVLKLSAGDSAAESAVSKLRDYLKRKDRLGVVGKSNLPLTDIYISPFPFDPAKQLLMDVSYGKADVDKFDGPLMLFGLMRVDNKVPRTEYSRTSYSPIFTS